MKKAILLYLLAALFQTTHAQVIQLTFTATVNGAYGALDSVSVSNLTYPCDTVLHWPDTTLLLGYVGIQQPFDEELSEFFVRLASANPCANRAIVQVFVPASGDVELKITDISGRLIQKSKKYLSKGLHSFQYCPDKQGISFVSAAFKSVVKSAKIIYSGAESGNTKLDYLGDGHSVMSPKSFASTLSFAFVVGDSLLLKAWYNGNSSEISAAPQTSTSFTFSFASGNSCPGLAQFTYGGQTYNTVQIGTQCIMRENLNIGDYVPSDSTGSPHSEVSDNGIIEKYCYDNDTANCTIYGGLYDWREMMQYTATPGIQGICPPGWHIPTDGEWATLLSFLGGITVAGGSMKETGFTHWLSPNTGATNSSGFTALGAGQRNMNGFFQFLQNFVYFWSSSELDANNAGTRIFYYYAESVNQYWYNKSLGCPIRCFKN